jgi:hypothetical protein
MASSEELNAIADDPDPELAPVEFDDQCFAEYFAESGDWDDDE